MSLRDAFLGLSLAASVAWAPPAGMAAEPPPLVKESDVPEMGLEDLLQVTVYGASKFQQPLSEAPSSVSIVTADEIKKYGYRTLGDILQSLRSFLIMSSPT